jgi:hypothetical protein
MRLTVKACHAKNASLSANNEKMLGKFDYWTNAKPMMGL